MVIVVRNIHWEASSNPGLCFSVIKKGMNSSFLLDLAMDKKSVWFLCLMAYQLFLGYLMPEPFSLKNSSSAI